MKYEDRIPTGVYGLDKLIGGGYRENTVNVVYGGTGVGKTTFSFQFALHALNRGKKVVYVSLEMNENQIIRDCKDMGWNEVVDHIEKENLHIIHEFGEDIMFLSRDLFGKISDFLEGEDESKIVVDPLTHLTFSLKSKNERKSLSKFFNGLRKLGTALITLEEGAINEERKKRAVVPLYLADSIIKLENLGYGEMYDRILKIIKHRGSHHGESLYPMDIIKGIGIIVEPSDDEIQKLTPQKKYNEKFEEIINEIEKEFDGRIKKSLVDRIEILKDSWTRDEDPREVVDRILETERIV